MIKSTLHGNFADNTVFDAYVLLLLGSTCILKTGSGGDLLTSCAKNIQYVSRDNIEGAITNVAVLLMAM